MNSLVHVFMYTCVQGSVQRLDPSANARPPAASLHRHYAARAVGINTPLKAALTSIQLIQFVLYLWHTVWVLLLPDPTSCSKPLVPIYLGMLQAAVFFILFANFFVQAYIFPRPKPGTGKVKAE